MRRTTLFGLGLALAVRGLLAAPPAKPKLILFIVVDQCRYDYLTKYAAEFTGGFKTLLNKGAQFGKDSDDFFPTLTASSHALLLTGAMPSATGIVGNDWFDRKSRKHVMSVTDDSVKLVGTDFAGPGLSPRPLLAPTVGDQLKKAHPHSRVIAISTKDRSAILLGGQHPDGAYWFDEHTGNFITSSYYTSTLPDWVRAFNDTHTAAKYLEQSWAGHTIGASQTGYKAVQRSPFGDELAEVFAEKAIAAEHLGKGPDSDILAISFPATDYAGHDYGPGTAESHETLLGIDRTLDRLFHAVDLSNTLVVLTSDHGIPQLNPQRVTPLSDVPEWVGAALEKKYGPGEWVAGCWDLLLYLNTDLIAEKKLNRAEVNRAAADALLAMPHMARAYTREQLMTATAPMDETLRRMKDGFHLERGADVEFLPEENWVFTGLKTTHGSTYEYDTHVPLVFMGAGIAPGTHSEAVRSNDIAPTLAKILGVPAPAASVGRVLSALY